MLRPTSRPGANGNFEQHLNSCCKRAVDLRAGDKLPQDPCIFPNWHDNRGQVRPTMGPRFDPSNETHRRTSFCHSGSRRPAKFSWSRTLRRYRKAESIDQLPFALHAPKEAARSSALASGALSRSYMRAAPCAVAYARPRSAGDCGRNLGSLRACCFAGCPSYRRGPAPILPRPSKPRPSLLR